MSYLSPCRTGQKRFFKVISPFLLLISLCCSSCSKDMESSSLEKKKLELEELRVEMEIAQLRKQLREIETTGAELQNREGENKKMEEFMLKMEERAQRQAEMVMEMKEILMSTEEFMEKMEETAKRQEDLGNALVEKLKEQEEAMAEMRKNMNVMNVEMEVQKQMTLFLKTQEDYKNMGLVGTMDFDEMYNALEDAKEERIKRREENKELKRKVESVLTGKFEFLKNRIRINNCKIFMDDGKRLFSNFEEFQMMIWKCSILENPLWITSPGNYEVGCSESDCCEFIHLADNIREDGVSVQCPDCFTSTILGSPKQGFQWVRISPCDHCQQVKKGENLQTCLVCGENCDKVDGGCDVSVRTPRRKLY